MREGRGADAGRTRAPILPLLAVTGAGAALGWLAITPVAFLCWGMYGDAPWPEHSHEVIQYGPPIAGALVGLGIGLMVARRRARRDSAEESSAR